MRPLSPSGLTIEAEADSGTSAGGSSFSSKLNVWSLLGNELEEHTFTLISKGSQPANELTYVDLPDLERPKVVSKAEAELVDLSWFQAAAEQYTRPVTPSDLVPVISGLTALLTENSFSKVSLVLKSLDSSIMAPEMMVAVLRTTLVAKRLISRAWGQFLKDVRRELVRRNLDASRILRGLT